MTKTQRGLAVFLFMAFVPVWACDIFMSEDNPLYWYTAIFCSLGGFAASYAEGGLDGLRAFGRRTLRVAGSLRFIVIGYLIPLGLGLGWMALRAAGKLPSAFHPALDAGFLTMLATAWITGPFAEEFGWRGYLQNTLLTRMSPFLTALVVALIWAVWHLPAFYDSVFSSLRSTLGFASHCLTLSLLLVWLVPRAGGSVWPAVFLHWSANTHGRLLEAAFPTIGGANLPGGASSAPFYLGAVLLFVAWQRRYYFRRAASASAPPEPLSA